MKSILLLLTFTFPLAAQPPRAPDLAAQREAMKRLQFLAGKWEGEATVTMGPAPVAVLQSESVEFKLDGLLLLVEGTGRDPATGKVVFSALATIVYDDAARQYRFRAFSDGRSLDTELKVQEKGFEWGFTAGPAVVKYVMTLNDQGAWVETGEVKVGDGPSRRTIQMKVTRRN